MINSIASRNLILCNKELYFKEASKTVKLSHELPGRKKERNFF